MKGMVLKNYRLPGNFPLARSHGFPPTQLNCCFIGKVESFPEKLVVICPSYLNPLRLA